MFCFCSFYLRTEVLHHTDMVGELTASQVAVSSASESELGRSPRDTFRAEVVGELAAEFQKVEDQC
jgi:hypothetical protein